VKEKKNRAEEIALCWNGEPRWFELPCTALRMRV